MIVLEFAFVKPQAAVEFRQLLRLGTKAARVAGGCGSCRAFDLPNGCAGGEEVDAVHEQNAVFACCQGKRMGAPHGANCGARPFIVVRLELVTCAHQGLLPGTFVGLTPRRDVCRLLVTADAQQAKEKKGKKGQTMHGDRAIGGLSYKKKAIFPDFCGYFGRNEANNVG